MKKYIPSIVTLLNLAAGFIAILLNDPFWGPVLVVSGALFDLLDGMLAKALHAVSETGKQLDSLADLVTFGLAPAYLYYQHVLPHTVLSVISASVLPVFGSLRLARFNVKQSGNRYFNGLPIPANGLFFISFPLLLNLDNAGWIGTITGNQVIIIILPLLFGLLMISNLKMFSFKLSNLCFKQNVYQYLLIILSVIAILIFKWKASVIIIPVYIGLSVLYHFRYRTI